MDTPIAKNFLTSITGKHQEQIEKWLMQERKATNSGFYCNWKTINKSISQGNICCVSDSAEIVGFITYHSFERVLKIDIAEIKPGLRHLGLGKYLADQSLEAFTNRGIAVVELQCNPPESVSFWRKVGFLDFPTPGSNAMFMHGDDDIRLFKKIAPSTESSRPEDDAEVIEIWAKEPCEINNFPPDWKFEIMYEESTKRLVKPIIHPCKPDWKIRWRKAEVIYSEKKAKYFSQNNICQGDFIVIETLPDR